MCRAPEAGFSSVIDFGSSGLPQLSCDPPRMAILMSSWSGTGPWQCRRRVTAARVTKLQPVPAETALMPAKRLWFSRHLVIGKAPQIGNRVRMPECHSSLRCAMGPKLPLDSSRRGAEKHSPNIVHPSVSGDLKRLAACDPLQLLRTADSGCTSSNGDGLNHRH